MRRVPLILVAALLALLAFAAPVAAAGERTQIPLEEFTFEYPAEVCGFAVSVELIAGTVTFQELGTDARGVEIGRQWMRATAEFTNVATGATFQTQERGPSIGRFRPDGSSRIAYHGSQTVWYFAGDPTNLGQGLWYVQNGLTVEEYDAEGNPVSAHSTGTVTDICAALS